jgi:Leucine-rich repeat (LRR) protein
VAAAVLLVGVSALLLGQLVIKLYDEKGRKIAEFTVPEGGKVVIEEEGKGRKVVEATAPARTDKADSKPAATSLPPADRKNYKWWTPTPEHDEFVQRVAKLPAQEQIEAVRQRLKKINPEFDGKLTPTVENGLVTGLAFSAEKVTDVTPVRAFPEFKMLDCSSPPVDAGGKPTGRFWDLSQLAGLKLTSLICYRTCVFDLAPLKGMPLNHLQVEETEVSDLTPLKGLPLQRLSAPGRGLSDLSLFKGMPLTLLGILGSDVADLSALRGLPLESLSIPGTRVTDLSVLRDLKLKALSIDNCPIDDLRTLRGIPLEELYIPNTRVSDLSPLRGMPLTILRLHGTRISDLLPLKGMPLESLFCTACPVRDLTPLAGAPLRELTYDFRHAYDPDEKLLRSFPLETVNGKPAVDFWHELAERRKAVDAFVAATSKLSPEEQVQAVTRRLREVNPEFRAALGHVEEDGKLAQASLAIDKVADLTPLRAFTSLRRLRLVGARDELDLSPLGSLPLEELTAPDNVVYTNARVLLGQGSLKQINGRPLAEFRADVQNLQAAEWALSKGSRLATLVVRQQDKEITVANRSQLPAPPFRVVQISIGNDEDIITADLERLHGLLDLRIFHVPGSHIDDAGLDILQTLPTLSSLDLRGSRITDAGLGAVSQMPSLTKLIISETSVTDMGIKRLAACRSLRSVWLDNTKVTGHGVESLLQLTYLTDLICAGVVLSHEDVAGIVNYGKRLETIALSLTGDDDVAAVVKMPRLKNLSLVSSPVTDRCVEIIASNPRLKVVGFSGCRGISDQGIAHLRKMPQLEYVWLSDTGITDAGAAHLVGLKQLNNLVYSSTRVGHGAVPFLKQMTSLRHLNVVGTQMTAADIAELRQALPQCNIHWDGKAAAPPAGEPAKPVGDR